MNETLDSLLSEDNSLAKAHWLELVPRDLPSTDSICEEILTDFLDKLIEHLPSDDHLPEAARCALDSLAREIALRRFPKGEEPSLAETQTVSSRLAEAVKTWNQSGHIDPGWVLQIDCAAAPK